jgi:putative transposase
MHCIWTLPEVDADYAGRWRAIKLAFSKCLPAVEPRSTVMLARGERGVWQRRYWEHTIRDGFVAHPAEWPYSSFSRCMAAGLYPADRCGGDGAPFETGERKKT